MPLVGHAEGNDAIASPNRIGPERERIGPQQRRAGAGNLIQQRLVGGGHEGDLLVACGLETIPLSVTVKALVTSPRRRK